MKARDRFEELTKEGCGRVSVFQSTNIIHAYTLELGFHQTNSVNQLAEPTNKDFEINSKYKMTYDYVDDNDQEMYQGSTPPLFTPDIYRNQGKNALVSILDVFEKNPYSRIPNTQYKIIDVIRREIAWECAREDRFRSDPYVYKKTRKYSEYIYDILFQKFEKLNTLRLDGEFLSVKWPPSLIASGFLTKYIQIQSPVSKKK